MSDHDLEAFLERALDARLGSLKGLIVAARLVYGMGAVIVMVTLFLAGQHFAIERSKADIQLLQTQMAVQQEASAQFREDTAVIKSSLIEIKDSVKEVKADVKAWTGQR